MADDRDARIAQLEAEAAGLRVRAARTETALAESVEQQAAAGDVLRLVASSPTDLGRVLDVLVRTARRLCAAQVAGLHQPDGDYLRPVATDHDPDAPFDRSAPPRVPQLSVQGRAGVSARAFLDGRTIHEPDIMAVADEFWESLGSARLRGWRSAVSTPLLQAGRSIGVLTLYASEADAFTERQIRLLETFADQAVIAIENARLFEELERRNRELGEALERQTATAEVLRVIAASPNDLGSPSVLVRRAGWHRGLHAAARPPRVPARRLKDGEMVTCAILREQRVD